MSKSDRKSRISKARNINELMDLVSEIKKEFGKDQLGVSALITSLSASRKRPVRLRVQSAGNGEITFDLGSDGDLLNPNFGKTGGKIKLSKYVRPPEKAVIANNEVLKRLYDKLGDLQSILAVLDQDYVTDKKRDSAVRAVEALMAEVQGSVSEALQALQAIADKHVPKEFAAFCAEAYKIVTSIVPPSSYEGIDSYLYVSIQDGALTFSCYIEMDNLKDARGYSYSEYFVVLTGSINEDQHMEYSLNVLPSFKIPGAYPVGKPVHSVKDVTTRTRLLLTANDVISTVVRRPLATTQDGAKSALAHIPEVLEATLKDDRLVLKLKPGISDVNSVITQVTPALNALVGISSRSKSIFKHKIEKRRSPGSPVAYTYLSYVLTPMSKDVGESAITHDALSLIQSMLGLTAGDIQDLRSVLKGKL